jgi:hypothetical protein
VVWRAVVYKTLPHYVALLPSVQGMDCILPCVGDLDWSACVSRRVVKYMLGNKGPEKKSSSPEGKKRDFAKEDEVVESFRKQMGFGDKDDLKIWEEQAKKGKKISE